MVGTSIKKMLKYIYLVHVLGLSEIPLEDGIVGETFGNLIAEQFRRIKKGDRFWHETSDPTARFTPGR